MDGVEMGGATKEAAQADEREMKEAPVEEALMEELDEEL